MSGQDEIIGLLTDISERTARVEVKIDRLNRIEDRAEQASETANKAMQSSSSAHHRIDTLKDDTERDLKNFSDNLKWVWGAFVTLLGLIVSVFLKLFGGGGG